MQRKMEELENENEKLRQLLNTNGTNIIIEQAKRETELKKLTESIEKLGTQRDKITCNSDWNEIIDLTMPTFFGNNRVVHPKKFLDDIEKFITFKSIREEDQLILTDNALKGKAVAWITIMKHAYFTPDFKAFKGFFLKQYFSDIQKWEKFIKCTDAGKKIITTGYQEHFNYWMTQLKYLDTPRIEEEQAINLIVKHFPI